MVHLVLLLSPTINNLLLLFEGIQLVKLVPDLINLQKVFEGVVCRLQQRRSTCEANLVNSHRPILTYDSVSLECFNYFLLRFDLHSLFDELISCLASINYGLPLAYYLMKELEVQNILGPLLFPVFIEALGPMPEELLSPQRHYMLVTGSFQSHFLSMVSHGVQACTKKLQPILSATQLFHLSLNHILFQL